MTTLLIARHGNTFAPGETPTRVGARTDLPLVASGRKQAGALGDYLVQQDLVPDRVYTSSLMRTIEMARIAVKRCGVIREIEARACFDEIDYGPDENLPEADVVKRVGQAAIDAWNDRAVVPPGWRVDPSAIVADWRRFANEIASLDETLDEPVVLVVTSNGVARFAPHITDDYEGFLTRFEPKLATGAMGVLHFSQEDAGWEVVDWNIRPRA